MIEAIDLIAWIVTTILASLGLIMVLFFAALIVMHR